MGNVHGDDGALEEGKPCGENRWAVGSNFQ